MTSIKVLDAAPRKDYDINFIGKYNNGIYNERNRGLNERSDLL